MFVKWAETKPVLLFGGEADLRTHGVIVIPGEDILKSKLVIRETAHLVVGGKTRGIVQHARCGQDRLSTGLYRQVTTIHRRIVDTCRCSRRQIVAVYLIGAQINGDGRGAIANIADPQLAVDEDVVINRVCV